MFSKVIDSTDQLFQSRLSAAETYLRSLTLSTREDYQAEVMNRLNKIFALGTEVTPLVPLTREGPASAGDFQNNLTILNTDALAIINQLLSLETSAATLYNLFSSTQNSLRQSIREQIFESNQNRYVEAFVNKNNIKTTTGEIDYNTSSAFLSLVSETSVIPSKTEIGVSSVGVGVTPLGVLTLGDPTQAFIWAQQVNSDGSVTPARLELVFTFSAVSIVNRLSLALDQYRGLTLVSLSSSPDGNLVEDIFPELNAGQTVLSGASSGFSGDCILDFTPRQMIQLKLVIEDRGNIGQIGLRGISFSRRQYGANSQIQSVQMNAPLGLCWFSTVESTNPNLTSLTHQISYDGVHYSVIVPGTEVYIRGAFWYRALFYRLSAGFTSSVPEIQTSGQDPAVQSNFVVKNTSTTDLGGGIIGRVLNLTSVSGAIPLTETPFPGTLVVTVGSTIVGSSVYTFSSNTLYFLSSQTGVQIRYQTSSLSAAGLSTRQPYYSPILHEVSFEKV